MKLAIITGGSKGLGKSLIESFLNEGYEVKEFSRSGQSKYHINCDFSNLESTTKIIEETFSLLSEDQYSESILINNVGTLNPIGPIVEFKPESWINNININLNSAIITSGLFIKYFQKYKNKKIIVNISSGAAKKGYFGWSLYCASKAGLENFGNALAIEQEQQVNPIKVINVNPGIIDTEMQSTIRDTDEKFFPELSRFAQYKEGGDLNAPDTVAQAIFDVIDQNPENGVFYSVDQR